MSHVDEGLLHAYLDGACAPGDVQAAEVEAHLASCADCRGRLDDARALKHRAHDALRNATPIDVHVPPFEALLARKRGRPESAKPPSRLAERPVARHRGTRPPVRLAWAASVVLAISAGWMANELVRRDAGGDAAVEASAFSAPDADAEDGSVAERLRRERPGEAEPSVDSAPGTGNEMRVAEQPAAPDGRAADPASRGDDASRTEASAAQSAQLDPTPPPAAVIEAPTPSSDQPAPAVRSAEKRAARDTADRPADRDAEREPMPAMADLMRRQARDGSQVEALRVRPTPTAPLSDMADAAVTRAMFSTGDVIRLDTMPPALADGRAFAAHVALVNDYMAAVERGLWSNATAEQAASALGGAPARIEDVPPVETEIAAVVGRVLVRERYVLEDGASLELVQRPAALTAAAAENALLRDRAAVLPPGGVPLQDLGDSSPAFRGASAVAMSRSGFVLLLKGPVSHELLHDIATRIR